MKKRAVLIVAAKSDNKSAIFERNCVGLLCPSVRPSDSLSSCIKTTTTAWI